MKDGSCLTDRKQTHMEAHGSTLILTVDDEPTNHLVIEEIVTSHGYKVHSELDAREALKWVEDSPELPDLILLDCMMPEMSGGTLLLLLQVVAVAVSCLPQSILL